MEHCSNKVYINRSIKSQLKGIKDDQINADEWEINSEDLDKSFDSDNEELKVAPKDIGTALVIKSVKPKKTTKKSGRKFKHHINTNIMSIKLSVLKDDVDMATGDPIFCQKCHAVFNSFSKLNDDIIPEEDYADTHNDYSDQLWVWEFCTAFNIIKIEKEEIPTKDTLNYVLEHEEVKDETKVKSSADDTSLVFCIDISGSMKTPANFKKGDKKAKHFANFKKVLSCPMSLNSYKTHAYTRLDCVKAAINSQIELMDLKSSNKKVGIVTFSGSVWIIGDGKQTPITISNSDDLFDYNGLLKGGQKAAKTHMQNKISEIYESLKLRISALGEYGKTALGPGILTSIAMAAEGGNGSTVFICTDGIANVGIGALLKKTIPPKGTETPEEFYEKIANFANKLGVTINIVSIKGEECDLETLITLSEKTGGSVKMIESNDLKNDMEDILKREPIATNVTVKVLLHEALEFQNENVMNLNKNRTLLTKVIGNATEDSEFTFEYKLKDPEELKNLENFDIDNLSNIPFQAIIEYTRLDGMKCIRTITKQIKTTDDLNEVKKDARLDIMAVNASQQASKYVKRGDFRGAQAYAMNQKRFIKANAKSTVDKKVYSNWKGSINVMYSQLHKQNKIEEEAVKLNYVAPAGKLALSRPKKGYLSKMGDDLVSNMYNVSNFNSRALRM